MNVMADTLASFRNFREFDMFTIFQILCCLSIIGLGSLKSFEKNLLIDINEHAIAKNKAYTNDYDDGKLWYILVSLCIHFI